MAKKNRNSRRINFENNNVEVNENQTIAVSEESVEDNIAIEVVDTENTESIETPTIIDTIIEDNTEVVEEDVVEDIPVFNQVEEPVVEEVEDVVEEVPEVEEEKVYEPIEDSNKPIPELKTSPSPVVINKTPSSVKTTMNDKTEGSRKFQIVFVENGSPLQMVKTLKRLKAVGELFDLDDKTNTITGKVFQTFADAVACRKILAGKGLKPSIKVIG
jgi:hypothetical protein